MLLVVQLIEVDDADVRQLRMRSIRRTDNSRIHSQPSLGSNENKRTKSRWRKSKLSENKNVRIERPVLLLQLVDCLARWMLCMCHHFSFEIRSSKMPLWLCAFLFCLFAISVRRFVYFCSFFVRPLFYRFEHSKHSSDRQTRWTKETTDFVVSFGKHRTSNNMSSACVRNVCAQKECPRFMIILLFLLRFCILWHCSMNIASEAVQSMWFQLSNPLFFVIRTPSIRHWVT